MKRTDDLAARHAAWDAWWRSALHDLFEQEVGAAGCNPTAPQATETGLPTQTRAPRTRYAGAQAAGDGP